MAVVSIPAKRRLNRAILVSNLVAGVLVIVALVVWVPVFLLAAPFALAFVVLSSLAFPADGLVWRVLVAVGLAPVLATLCFVPWQVIAWGSGRRPGG